MCIGEQPTSMLRNWQAIASMTQSLDAICNQYINADENANLMLLTSYSAAGLVFGPYIYNTRYSHGAYLAEKEDIRATQLWGNYTAFYVTPKVYSGTNMDKTIFWKLPYIMEYTNNAKYSYSDKDSIESQLKKHLNPSFTIDAEGSTQENMLQAVLTFRRTETMHLGLRWFDIKRYGIEIPRRVMNADGVPEKRVDFLKKEDPRRALQLPNKVLDAGMERNPRNK